MAWKNHEDETLITNKQHEALSAEEKIKFYETSDEVVTSISKKEKNGKGQELDTESSES